MSELVFGTCSDCRGPLEEIRDAGVVEFRCLVGHRYSPEGLLSAHYEAQERVLWSAVVALEEAPNLVKRVADAITPEAAESAQRQAERDADDAKAVRKIIENLRPYITG
jgi:two-component system chemotaxis response regulator CheB